MVDFEDAGHLVRQGKVDLEHSFVVAACLFATARDA
jgi:hypothetical protein